MEIEEGNKVLTEFMGYEEYRIWFAPHKSWGALMDVWIKFRDLDTKLLDVEKYLSFRQKLYYQLYHANSPSDFFPHLVEAVKWYQSTKK